MIFADLTVIEKPCENDDDHGDENSEKAVEVQEVFNNIALHFLDRGHLPQSKFLVQEHTIVKQEADYVKRRIEAFMLFS